MFAALVQFLGPKIGNQQPQLAVTSISKKQSKTVKNHVFTHKLIDLEENIWYYIMWCIVRVYTLQNTEQHISKKSKIHVKTHKIIIFRPFSSVCRSGLVRFFSPIWTDRQPQPVAGCPKTPKKQTGLKKTTKKLVQTSCNRFFNISVVMSKNQLKLVFFYVKLVVKNTT